MEQQDEPEIVIVVNTSNKSLDLDDASATNERYLQQLFGSSDERNEQSQPSESILGSVSQSTSSSTRIVVRQTEVEFVNERYRMEVGPGLASAVLMQTIGAGGFLMKQAGPKWFDWISNRWLSRKTRTAIRTILDIIRRFKDHGVIDIFKKYSQAQIFWSLVAYGGLQRAIHTENLWQYYHADNATADDSNFMAHEEVDDAELLETLQHYSVYASAVYGWKLGYAMRGTTILGKLRRWRVFDEQRRGPPKQSSRGVPMGKRFNHSNWNVSISDMAFFLRRTGREESDIVRAEWGTDTLKPGYVIARDPARKALVFSIRGTWSLHDILTDLCCTSQGFSDADSESYPESISSLSQRLWKWFFPTSTNEGVHRKDSIFSAHHGMLESAQELSNLTQGVIEAELRKNPGYRLVLVGHSMGGGVAALLGTLWRKKFPISVFVYGPPCIAPLHASPPIGKGGGVNITSVVTEGDPFGCISLGHIAELSVALDRLCADAKLRERVLQSTLFRKESRKDQRNDSWWLVHTLRFLHADSTGEKRKSR